MKSWRWYRRSTSKVSSNDISSALVNRLMIYTVHMIIDNREGGGIGNACIYYMVTSRHAPFALEYSTVLWPYSYLVYDSNQTRTKCRVIEEVNKTVKCGF